VGASMQDVRLLSLYWAVVWVCSLSCYSWRIPSELFGAYRDRSVHPAVNDQIKIQRFVFSIFFFSCNLFFQQSSKVSGGIFQVFLLQQFAKNNFECRVKVTFGKKNGGRNYVSYIFRELLLEVLGTGNIQRRICIAWCLLCNLSFR